MSTVIFFDLDGVLADFVSGALAAHNATLPMDEVTWGFPGQIGFTGADDPKFWSILGESFWSSLPLYPDGLCLLRTAERLVGAENIAFLTSPCDTAGCVDGKRAWVARHFPGYRRRLFVGAAKQFLAGPGKVLVDDHDANIDAFSKANGVTVQVPRPWNRLKGECHPGGMFDVPAVAKELKSATDLSNGPRAAKG